MIVIKIHGGLGNQMFQYAFGRNLSLIHGVPLCIDSSYLRGPNQSGRSFCLDAFPLSAPEATREEMLRYTGLAAKLFDSFRPETKKKYIREGRTFDKSLFQVSDAYLDGHWQNEKYFHANKETVRKDFTLKDPLREAAQKALAAIAASPSATSLHIRRGDYVSIKKIADVHGTLPFSYYKAAMKTVLDRFPDAHFFISSDDILWVKEYFPKGYPVTFVSDRHIAAHEELFLMSTCKHNIIANSTMSWWGAWLNPNPSKLVLAPSLWTKTTSPSPALEDWKIIETTLD